MLLGRFYRLVVTLILTTGTGPQVLRGAPLPRLATPVAMPLTVQWQMIRSRPQSMLAGTLTETYAVGWSLHNLVNGSELESSLARLHVSWTPDTQDARTGTLMLTRGDLVRLLGIEQELPQDSRVWQAEGSVIITIQGPGGRVSSPVFRYVDDNGTVVIRLSARVASNP